MIHTPQVAVIKLPQGHKNVIRCTGSWDIAGINGLDEYIPTITWPDEDTLVIDGSAVEKMDSAGAWVLEKCVDSLRQSGKQVQFKGFSTAHTTLLETIANEIDTVKSPVLRHKPSNWLYKIGKEVVHKFNQLIGFFNLIGELLIRFLLAFRDIRHFQLTQVAKFIETTGIQALPIVGLLMFLIGVVLAYQTGVQLSYYGADTLIVFVTGTAIIREFAPLITAIIIAGRTSSSFTAEIGLMKVNEEIDALRTMGLSPIGRIVLPRMIALVIVLPLLVICADIFGILGSMVISKQSLDIGFLEFASRFQSAVPVRHLLLGLIKAPFFAIIITLVGCYQGFQVSSSAQSVGHQTTKSVVQAIFLIIIADGIFSISFSLAGL